MPLIYAFYLLIYQSIDSVIACSYDADNQLILFYHQRPMQALFFLTKIGIRLHKPAAAYIGYIT